LVSPEIFSPDLLHSKGSRKGCPDSGDGPASADDAKAARTANARTILILPSLSGCAAPQIGERTVDAAARPGAIAISNPLTPDKVIAVSG
jgi:hypothetical protein